jgi:hypothetical protein
MRSFLLVESLDLRPSNQYILVSESPSCLRLEEMCVCQVRRWSRWSPRYYLNKYATMFMLSSIDFQCLHILVLNGNGMWSLTLSKEHALLLFENKVLERYLDQKRMKYRQFRIWGLYNWERQSAPLIHISNKPNVLSWDHLLIREPKWQFIRYVGSWNFLLGGCKFYRCFDSECRLD